jgi:hypothetical protein
MDPNISWFYEKRAQSVIAALKKNRMNGQYLADPSQAAEAVLALIRPGAKVALGGSMTLDEAGVIDALRQAHDQGRVKLVDRFAPALSPEETLARLREGLTAEVMVSGVNAVTEQGELVFVDASCTRVAPILYGPAKVILVAGGNKIVPNLAYAQERIRHFVAPANAKRLGKKTPCAETGQCADCSSPERICNATVVIHKQANPERLHLILLGADLGL